MNRICIIALIISFLGLIYYIFNDIKSINSEKINDFSKIDNLIEKEPSNGAFYYQRANLLFEKGKYEEALMDAMKSVELGFPLYDAYILISLIAYRKGDWQMQEKYALMAQERDPTSQEGYLMSARAYYNLKKYKETIRDFYTAYQINKDDNILYEIAITYFSWGKYFEAVKILRELNNKYPKNPLIIKLLIKLYREMKFYNNSLYLVNILCEIEKNEYECFKTKSEILYEMGDYILAFNEISKISKLRNRDDYLFYCKVGFKLGVIKNYEYCVHRIALTNSKI